MQGREHSKGMGSRSLSQGSLERVWNGEGQAGLGTWSSKNRTRVCGWMGYTVGDLRTSSGCGEVWIGVPVRCYTECNMTTVYTPRQDTGTSRELNSYCTHRIRYCPMMRFSTGAWATPRNETSLSMRLV